MCQIIPLKTLMLVSVTFLFLNLLFSFVSNIQASFIYNSTFRYIKVNCFSCEKISKKYLGTKTTKICQLKYFCLFFLNNNEFICWIHDLQEHNYTWFKFESSSSISFVFFFILENKVLVGNPKTPQSHTSRL